MWITSISMKLCVLFTRPHASALKLEWFHSTVLKVFHYILPLERTENLFTLSKFRIFRFCVIFFKIKRWQLFTLSRTQIYMAIYFQSGNYTQTPIWWYIFSHFISAIFYRHPNLKYLCVRNGQSSKKLFRILFTTSHENSMKASNEWKLKESVNLRSSRGKWSSRKVNQSELITLFYTFASFSPKHSQN